MRQAATPSDIAPTYLYNMEQAGTCFIQYEELVKAIRAREAASVE